MDFVLSKMHWNVENGKHTEGIEYDKNLDEKSISQKYSTS